MNYQLNTDQTDKKNTSMLSIFKKFAPLLAGEKKSLIISFVALIINSVLNLIAPVLIGYTIDHYIVTKDYQGIAIFSVILLFIFLCAFIASYIQIKTIGGVAQRLLFSVRNTIFYKLQELPLAFFNQNKAGDLISRINNDTDKLNTFFSQSLMQFIGSIFMMIGSTIFLLSIHFELGVTSLFPAVIILIFTQLISGWIKRKNATSLKAIGGMSAEIQESLENFKVIVAFNRRDYFRKKFNTVNRTNFTTAVSAGYANNIFTPVYGLAANAAQIIVLFYGVYLISQGNFTVGLLISFLTYINRFYDPIRQMAALWASFQVALAAWDRISDILSMTSNLDVITSTKTDSETSSLLTFKKVNFRYPGTETNVLQHISFDLKPGKTYALVGPTGGGKTTTAGLMARLFDPTEGEIFLDGKDIRTYTPKERTQKIGFILQDPFLFTGTVGENILYGNDEYVQYSASQLTELIQKFHLEQLIERFPNGLDTPISGQGETISLGQRQLIAFMRAVLRSPSLLILDEATANIDTVTEQLLDEILKKLPKKTTKVIIAHRLNTIENADEIFFINAGEITRAGSLDHAIDMLMKGNQES